MKVYLAGPYQSRLILSEYADALHRHGYSCLSSWLNEPYEINAGTSGAALALDDATVAGHALTDIAEVQAADVFILFTSKFVGVEGGGGRHVETGVALAGGIPVIIMGEPENVFHRIPGAVISVPTWLHLLAQLKRMQVSSVPIAEQSVEAGHGSD